MKKIILTAALSLCAAISLSGCNAGGGSDMNKPKVNAEPIYQEREALPEKPDCPDGNFKDDCPDGNCPEDDCTGDDCPETGVSDDCTDGRCPSKRDGEPPRFPHVFEREHRRGPRPLPCPAKEN